MDLVLDIMGMMGPIHVERTVHLSFDIPLDLWQGFIIEGPNRIGAQWRATNPPPNGDLNLDGEWDMELFTYLHPYETLVWGTTTHYLITSWTWVNPPGSTGSAEFDF